MYIAKASSPLPASTPNAVVTKIGPAGTEILQTATKIAKEKGAIPFFKLTVEIKKEITQRIIPFKLNIELLTLTSLLFLKLRSATRF